MHHEVETIFRDAGASDEEIVQIDQLIRAAAIEAAKLKEEEVSRYVEERRDSIARGARRSRARFRL